MELVKKETSLISTSEEYLMIYRPNAMRHRYREVQTVSQALDVPSHSVAVLERELGREKLEALIKLQLVYLNELLGLKRPLGELQIDEIASEVVACHCHLTMADIHLIMRRAKSGYYGQYYDSLTMPKVLGWFADYFAERCKVAEERSLDAHSQNKEYNDTTRVSSEGREREAMRKAKAEYLLNKAQVVNETSSKGAYSKGAYSNTPQQNRK